MLGRAATGARESEPSERRARGPSQRDMRAPSSGAKPIKATRASKSSKTRPGRAKTLWAALWRLGLAGALARWPAAHGQPAQTGAGAHQALVQMLQVFNGNDSQQLEANHFRLLEPVGADWLLVGGR